MNLKNFFASDLYIGCPECRTELGMTRGNSGPTIYYCTNEKCTRFGFTVGCGIEMKKETT